MTASELWAELHSRKCLGHDRCHWCGNPCGREWTHDDLWPLIGRKSKSLAKCPANPWICQGCMLFRRPRTTILFKDKSLKDKQCAMDWSWLITDEGCSALLPSDLPSLWPLLLSPPKRFCLMLLKEPNLKNLIHLAICNDLPAVEVGTELGFTLNNIPHQFSVYELEQALRFGKNGKYPGVRVLIDLLGHHELPPLPPPPPTGGRPVQKDAGTVLKKKVN